LSRNWRVCLRKSHDVMLCRGTFSVNTQQSILIQRQ